MIHLTHGERRSLRAKVRRLQGQGQEFSCGLGIVYQDRAFLQLCYDIFNRVEPGTLALYQPVRDLVRQRQTVSRLLQDDPHHAERIMGNSLLFLPNVSLYTYVPRHQGGSGSLIAWDHERVVVLGHALHEGESNFVWVGSLPEYLLTWRVD